MNIKQLLLITAAFALSASAFAKDITVVSQEFMPLAGSGPGGKMVGAHFEIMKRVCEKMKYNCKFEIIPHGRGVDSVKNGEFQMMLALAKNPEREAWAYFPKDLTQVGYTYFVKKGDAGKYKSTDDFKGKSVAVLKGSAMAKALEEENKKVGGAIKIEEEATSEAPLKKLSGGRYGEGAGAFGAKAVFIYQATTENLPVEPVGFDAKLQSHSIAISKKAMDAAEFEKVQAAFNDVMKMPEVQKIVKDSNLAVHPNYK